VHSSEYLHGISLFNRAAFFEAHEVLEDVWRAAPVPEKKFFQGLIQIAVGLHHYGNGNLVGARSLLARAARNLGAYPETFGGIQLTQLLHCVAEWQQALADNKPAPAFPKLDMEST
jgi:predicted metal-dependent hydrolase